MVNNKTVEQTQPLRRFSKTSALLGLLAVLFLFVNNSFLKGQTTIFTENVGNTSINTTVAAYAGWSSGYTMTGTATVLSNNTPFSTTSDYPTASGFEPVEMESINGGASESWWQIEGINTQNYGNIQLSFGIYKTVGLSDGTNYIVEVSSDGSTYTQLSYTALAVGGGTAGWYYRTCTGTIPSCANLRIRFRDNSPILHDLFRIDDVLLTGNFSACNVPYAPNVARNGSGTVTLNASGALSSYNWWNAPTGGTLLGTGPSYTTPVITTNTTYYVSGTDGLGCESPRIPVVASVGYTYYSKANGNWNDPNTWSTVACGNATNSGTFPQTIYDDVVICNTVTLNGTYSCKSLTVQNTGIMQYDATAARTLTIAENLTIAAGGFFQYTLNGGNVHALQVQGNISNSGTFDLYRDLNDYVDLFIYGTSNSLVSGAGTWDLHSVYLNKGNKITEIEFTTNSPYTSLAANGGTWSHNKGTYIHNNTASFNFLSTANYTLNSYSIVDARQGTLTFASAGSSLTLEGILKVSGGTVNVGSTGGVAPNGIKYLYSNFIIPGITISSGTLSVFQGINYSSTTTDPFLFTMSGGSLNLNSGTTASSVETFRINDVAASSFNMSGGTITLQKINSGTLSDFNICGTAGTVASTGGTVVFGNASTPAASTFNFTPYPNATLPNIRVSGAPASAGTLKPFAAGNFKFSSLYIEANKIFDVSHNANATDNRTVTLTSTYDGTNTYFNNNAGGSNFLPRQSTVIITSTGNVTLSALSGTEAFYNLTINKASGDLTLGSAVSVAASLALTAGRIITTSSFLFKFNSGATYTGGSATSHISGPSQRFGTGSFTFPIGKGGIYRQVGINPAGIATDAFTAEYFNADPNPTYNTASKDATISNVSTCEYWNLTRSAGTTATPVTLYYGTGSCNLPNYSLFKTALWNGSQWTDQGSTAATGNATAGSLTTSTSLSTLGNFTLAATAGPTYWVWDTSPAAGIQPGNGTWGVDAFWTLRGGPGTTLVAWPGAGNSAYFEGIDGTYTITVNGNQNADSLVFSNSGYTLNGGSITKGNVFIHVAAGKTATINSILAGSLGLTKTATSGILNLNGANTYTGKTTLLDGDVYINSLENVGGGASALGAPTTIANGTIDLAGSLNLYYTGAGHTSDRVIQLNSGGTTIRSVGAAILNLTGGVNGSGTDIIFRGFNNINETGALTIGGGRLFKTDNGTLFLSNASSNFSGNTQILKGIVSVNSISNIGSNSPIGTGSTIQLGQNTTGFGTFQFTGPAGGSTNRAFQVTSIGGPTGGGILENTVAGQTLSISGTITTTNTPLIKLTGIGNGHISSVISGTNTTLEKSGTGTWKLSAINTYTGNTTVTAGTLNVTGTINSSTTVNSGATIAGTGTISTLTVDNGGIVTPGDFAVGTLNTSTLVFNSTSVLNYELGTTGSSDKIAVSGSMNLDGVINVTSVAGFGAGTYTILTCTGAIADFGLSVGTAPAGYSYVVQISGSNVNLVVTASSTSWVWDTSTSPGIQPGNGTWGVDSYWTQRGGAGTTLIAWPGAGNSAYFEGIDGTYAITVSGTQSVDSLVFTNGGYTLSGGTLTKGNSAIDVASGKTATINSVISGSSGLRKTSLGILYLNGLNTYTGQTIAINGDLYFNSLLNISGGSSALGSPTTTPNGTLNIQNASTLYYNGSAGSSDRPISFTNIMLFRNLGPNPFTLTGGITGDNSLCELGTVADLTETGVIATTGVVQKTGTAFLYLSNNANSFTGQLRIFNGTISGSSIANSGTNSCFGAGSSVRLGSTSGSNFGKLQYTGSSTSTDKQFIADSPGGIGAGGIIENTTAGQTLTLTGAITGTNNPLFRLDGAGDGIVTSVISTGLSLEKTGTGTWTLGGANTYTGTTTVTAGTLNVTGSLASGSAVTVASGATLAGNGTAAGSINVAASGIIAPGNGTTGSLSCGPLTFNNTSILSYELGNTASSDKTIVTGNLILDGTINITNVAGFGPGVYPILTASGTITNNTLSIGTAPTGFTYTIQITGSNVNLIVGGGTNWVWDSSTAPGIQPANGTWGTNNYWTPRGGDGTLLYAWPGAGNNAWFEGVDGTYAITVSGTQSVDSITFNNSGYTLSGGTIAKGVGVIEVAATKTATISSVISGGSMINKTGAGQVTLSGNNTFSGGWTHIAGDVVISHNNGFGTSGVIMNGTGRIFPSNGISIPNTLTVTASAPGSVQGTITLSSGNATWAGAININAATTNGGHFSNFGAGTLTISGTITGAAGVIIEHRFGTVLYTGGGTATYFYIEEGSAKIGSSNGLPSNCEFQQSHGSLSSSLDLNGFGQTFSAISSAVTTGTHTITNSQAGASTLTISGSQGISTTYRGAITGNIVLQKNGATALTLTGTSTYSGATGLNAGTIHLTGTLTNSVVTCNSSATLSGNGTISNNCTISNIVIPGDNATGTLSTGPLVLNSGAILIYEIGAIGSSDKIAVTGNLTLDGTINLTAVAGFTAGTYTILTSTGTITNNTLSIGTVPVGYSCSVQISGANVNLVVSLGTNWTWDTSTAPGIQPGNGTWGVDAFWTPRGGAGTSLFAWPGAGNNAFFEGANGSYSVTVNGTQSVDSVTFNNTGYTLNGGTLSLTGAAPVITANVNATSNTSFVNNYTKDGIGELFVNPVYSATNLTIKAGTLSIMTGGGDGFQTDILIQSGGTLKLLENHRIENQNDIVINAGGTFDVNGYVDAIGSISGAGNVINNNNVAGLLLDYQDGQSYTFSGVISGTGPMQFRGNTSSTTAGTTILTGVNTYSGITYIGGMGAGNTSKSILVLAGGDNRLNPLTTLQFGETATSGINDKLVLGNAGSTSNQTVAGISDFGTGTFSIVGGNAAVSTLTINNAINNTFSGKIGGVGVNENNIALTKTSTGTLTLSGAHTYTGATTVTAGTLLITGSTGAGSAVSVASGATLSGTGSAAGSVNVAAGGIIAPGNGTTGTLSTGPLTFNNTSILTYELGNTGTSDKTIVTGNLILDGTINITNVAGFGPGVYPILTASGTITNNTLSIGTAPGGFSYTVQIIGSNVNLIVAAGTNWTWDSSTAPGIQPANGTWGVNAYWTPRGGDGTLLYAWPGAGNNAWFEGADGAYAITVSGTQSVDSITFNNSGYTLTGGTIAKGVGVIEVAATKTATISSVIAGTSMIYKTGSGQVTLSGNNTFSGGYTHLNGDVVVANNNAFGTTGVTMNGNGRIILSNGITVANTLTVTASTPGVGQGTITQNSGSSTWSGPININGNATNGGHFAIYGGGTISITGAITGAAGIPIKQRIGTIRYSGGGSATYFVLNEGTAIIGATNGLPANAEFQHTNPSLSSTLDLNGFNQTFSSITSVVSTGVHTITNTQAGASILTISGSQGISTTYRGSIAGNIILQKNGATALTLTGISTFTGATGLNAGTLHLKGTLTNSAVTVNSGATLSGNGTITNNCTINNIVIPGDSTTGTLSTGPLVLNSGAVLNYEIGAIGASDKIAVTGNLTLNGTINLTSVAGFAVGTHTILTCTGTITNFILDIGTGIPGYNAVVQISGGNVNLVITGSTNWTWDLTTTAGYQPGDGIWGTDSYWTQHGGTGTTLVAWPGAGNNAWFEGANGTYNVTVNGTQSVDSIFVRNTGYTLSGGTLSFNGSNPSIDAAVSNDATINSILTSPNTLHKTGAGTISLNYSGGTNHTLGRLHLHSGITNIQNGNFILSTADVNGKSLTVDGNLNMNAGSISCLNRAVFGFAGAAGTSIISGGSITGQNLVIGWNSAPIVSFTGGTHSFTSSIYHKDAGTGTLNISNTTMQCADVHSEINSTSEEFDLNLNSGAILETSRIYMTLGATAASNAGPHNFYFNINGGTITANGNTNPLLDSIYGGGTSTRNFEFNLNTGGLTINSNGFDVKAVNALRHLSSLGATPDGGIIKTGIGSLDFFVSNTYTGPTVITQGSITLKNNNVIADASNCQLNGGSLSAGFNETLGSLTLSENSSIYLVTGNHTVNFASSNANTWTAGKTLVINDWLGGYNGTAASGANPKIFIGTTAELSAAKLLQIQFFRTSDGLYYPATQLASGEVVPCLPKRGTLTAPANVCTGTNSGTITLSNFDGSITRWESSLNNFATAGTPIANTTTTQNYLNLTATTYYRAVLQYSNWSDQYSDTLTIIVNPNNTAGVASSSPTLCINTALTAITHATTGATGIGAATGLPAGVTAAWAANTITISGTPTASGTFNYSIPLTGGCGTVSATGTITVTPANTVGAASSTPTLCINTALTAITHSTTGATGIGAATGLPAGVSAAWAANTITISGTPTASGIFNYSIPLTGGCGTVSATGTITVTPANTVGAASSTPTLCINTALTAITHATTGATGIGAATGLPAGVTAAWAANTITISGTPTASGTFNYSIPLTGGCGTVSATGTITVTPVNTVGAASSSPTLCINTALTAITHATTGTTGIGAATGLPAGVTAAWATNTITISGTPTASGTFNYSIPLTGGCGAVNASGTITVTPDNTIGAASSTPTLCINTALTAITHATTGATGIGAATGLPAGVTAAWAANTITISGTPTASGTFNYSIPLTGGCGTVSATGTITVTPTNTVGAASSSPTLCINTALTAITHATTGATGIGAATGLPAGVSAAWAANTITISGTPTASGTFNYSIPLTGGCGTINATGTITVTPDNTVGAASSSPSVCINTVMTNVTHTTTGATGIGAATGLPAGVSAAWAANTITISGTPTASGTFNYSIPLTGGCGTINATGTITVVTVNTTSVASSTPTLCINTTLTNITHATTGATGIGAATGLPAGVTAAWAANVITISGTPTASGTFNYSVPLTGSCGTVSATGTITVTPDNTVGAASSTPTLCINTALTNITHTTTGATGIGAATGLPVGVSAAWAANTITISGTPTASGTFNYSIPLTGGCGTVNATGTITVTPDNTVGAASSSPSVCINTVMTNVTHTTTGATGIGAATGLPAGVSAAWAANTITISGTPTASGTFNYSIPLTGGCGTINATGTITVATINTAGVASSSPTLCINTILTAITHSTTGATGIGAATGLPAGVSAAWAANVITISGTPTASGTFNYDIPLTGGCGTVSATGTITVNPDNTVGAASSTPTLCINTTLTNITHATTGATGIGAATGLPAGVSAAWAANTITISGTPTASGTFNYSIPLTGGCGTISATGTITVNPLTTAGTASSTPTVCLNTTMTNVTHTTTGATAIGAATGLPAGVSAAWAANTITISGTPTASGTFNYSIPLTGGCGAINASGTITVSPINTVSAASSTPTVCLNVPITAITHATTGASGIGAATGLPSGLNASWSTNTISIQGSPTASGTFNYSIPLTGGCGAISATGTITVTAAAIGGLLSSDASVCSGNNTGTLTLSGNTGTIVEWLSSNNNFLTPGTPIANTTNTLVYTNLTQTTYYRVSVQSGSCSSSNSSTVTITVTSAPPTPSGSGSAICASGQVTLTASGATNYNWYDVPTGGSALATGSTFTTPVINSSTTYYLTSDNGTGCESARVAITANVSTASVGGTLTGADSVLAGNNSGTLNLSGQNGTIIRWESSNDDFATAGTPIANTSNSLNYLNLNQTKYYRAVIQNNPCPISYSNHIVITVLPDTINRELTIAPGLSPNGDGINDNFIILNNTSEEIKLSVFNRWGNLVYENNNYNNEWDGKANQGVLITQNSLPDGTYFYIIQLGDKKYSGYLTLKY